MDSLSSSADISGSCALSGMAYLVPRAAQCAEARRHGVAQISTKRAERHTPRQTEAPVTIPDCPVGQRFACSYSSEAHPGGSEEKGACFMGEFEYAPSDDFSKAAARIVKMANDGLADAQLRLASEGFFKRAKLRRTFGPSMALLRDLIGPVQTHGIDLVRNTDTAKAYCESVFDLISKHLQAAIDADAGQRKLLLTSVSLMAQSTAEVLTKASHDRTWLGSEQLARELREASAG